MLKQIPKILHFIWIGDVFKMPYKCMKTWADKNSDYKVVLWGNEEIEGSNWKNSSNSTTCLQKKITQGLRM